MTQKLNFPSGAQRCVAWLTLPICQGPHPVVVLVHGGGATHEMKLGQYEAAFSAAGFAVLAFDYRHFGESEGLPRQIMSVRKHLEDVDAALAFVQTRPELDASRVALWGTSMGASHVVTLRPVTRNSQRQLSNAPCCRGVPRRLRADGRIYSGSVGPSHLICCAHSWGCHVTMYRSSVAPPSSRSLTWLGRMKGGTP